MTKAAGILFITDDGQALLLKRGDGSDYPGAWCFPGGTTEGGETPEETAERETIEELGFLPEGKRILLTRQISAEGVDYTTFIQRVKKPFVPKLNGEHDAFMWGDPEKILGESLPAPLPPGPSDGWGSITSAFRSDDAGFEEGDHPRDEDGKFAEWGGSSSTKIKRLTKKEKDQVAEQRYQTRVQQFARNNLFRSEIDNHIKTEDLGNHSEWQYLETEKGKSTASFKEIHGAEPAIEIHWLSAQKRGAGREAMNLICSIADKHRVNLELDAVPFTGMQDFKPDRAQLVKFYESFGFVKSNEKTLHGYPRMIRKPDDNVRSDDAGFEESDHPRDEDGKFTSGGGSGGKGDKGTSRDSLSRAQTVNGKRVNAAGLPLPPHIEKLKLPPAWKDVQYSEDPGASLLAVGRDAKGRVQSVYSAKFVASQAEAKFSRISELMTKFDSIVEQNDNARKSDNPKTVEAADCLNLIMKMGVRPGSETDTGAKVKAYGATTLEGKHVVQTEDGVFLKFTGKKGVALSLRVDDKELANNLVERANKAGADGQLFNTTDKALLDHTHSMDGGSFKTKDLRTRLGTQTALDAVNSMPKPKDEKEYKKAVMEVAGQVSKKLGNTPVIALQSYISPVVFAAWKIGE